MKVAKADEKEFDKVSVVKWKSRKSGNQCMR